jgi:4-hydroxybenzoate polyprenyltransferase
MENMNSKLVDGSTQEQWPARTLEFWIQSARLCRPYSLLWFVSLPTATMTLWLTSGSVDVARLILLLIVATLADAGLTTWNDYCDVKTDGLSTEPQRNTRPIVAGLISARWAGTQVAVLLCAALIAASVVSFWFSLLLAGFIVYGLIYSARPVYASGRPVISQIFWIVLWPSMYVGIALVMHGDIRRGWLYILGVVLYMGIGETLAKDIRDLENDAQAAKNTTPVVFGHKYTATISAVAFVMGSVVLVGSTFLLPRGWNPGLTAALTVVLTTWSARVISTTHRLHQSYSKSAARSLHVESIQFFIVVNLLFIVGLAR